MRSHACWRVFIFFDNLLWWWYSIAYLFQKARQGGPTFGESPPPVSVCGGVLLWGVSTIGSFLQSIVPAWPRPAPKCQLVNTRFLVSFFRSWNPNFDDPIDVPRLLPICLNLTIDPIIRSVKSRIYRVYFFWKSIVWDSIVDPRRVKTTYNCCPPVVCVERDCIRVWITGLLITLNSAWDTCVNCWRPTENINCCTWISKYQTIQMQICRYKRFLVIPLRFILKCFPHNVQLTSVVGWLASTGYPARTDRGKMI